MVNTVTINTSIGTEFTSFSLYNFLSAGPGNVDSGATSTAYVANIAGTKVAVTGSGFTFSGGLPVTGAMSKSITKVAGTPIVTTVYGTPVDIADLTAAITSYRNTQSITQFEQIFANQSWVMTGNSGADSLGGFAMGDTLNGGAGNDLLVGRGGNDVFNPGAATVDANGNGFEVMIGNQGNDTFNVGSSGALHYIALYAFDGGTRGVNVDLSLDRAIDTYGNTDTLRGITFVVATAKNDIVKGDATNDIFGLGGGTDTVDGLGGYDVIGYSPEAKGGDSFGFTRGVVVTMTGDNVGTVRDPTLATDSFRNVERIEGTKFADIFNGGSFADEFTGHAGADTFKGGAGVDTVNYFFEHFSGASRGVRVNLLAKTGVDGFGATDSLTDIENIVGTNFGDSITGSAVANALDGRNGNDTINGGAGLDVLTGGGGKDTFVFSTTLSAATNVDRVVDFSVLDDTIGLSKTIFTAFAGTPLNATIGTAAFAANAAGVATQADDRIVYDTDSGALYYDTNGNVAGGSVKIAQLAAHLSLSQADFLVLA